MISKVAQASLCTRIPAIQRHFWWIGSVLILIPVLYLSAGNILPIVAYYGTRVVYTIVENTLNLN